MASTPKKKQVASLGKKEQSPRSPKSPIAPKSNKSKSSMGLDLLLIAIGTSLIGLGVLGYLFYQELLSSTRREVDRSAEAQTRQLETKLGKVQQTVDGVASGAKVLSQQQPKPKSSSNYQGLLVDGLQSANTVAGIGISSNNNLLFPNPKPTVPYVWREQSGLKTEIAGQKLPAPNDKFLSTNRLDIQKAVFYQETIKGKASWSQPYTALGKTIVTYSAPIADGTQVLGIVNADAIATELLSLTATPSPDNKPDNKMGFVVVEASGKVITASSHEQNTATDALANLASQAKTAPTGIIQTGGNLWAYRKVTGSDWLVFAYVPESEIINKLLVLVGGAAIGISAILAIAVLAFVNSLKKRLQPLSEECDRFLSQQGNPSIVGKDEIDRLGLSLKSTFQQVKANEIRLRGELVQGSASEDESTAIQQNIAETQLMEAEVGDLLDVVSSMEEGNLTIEAQVNDRATGLVADTLNRLREKLVEIISSVLGTAQQVAQGASDLEELARTVVLNTAEQAQSVSQGQALTEQVAAIAARSVSQVNVANQSLQEVRDTVASGQTAINTLTDSISVLQTGSAQIVQRMKTLGEFVGLAEQFVQDQGQIASLTQVLALNATLVAARAAEQKDPKQFTSVAREFEAIAGQVNDLATQTNDGLTVLQQRTSQIQTVVTAIDTEVQNLSGLVAGFTAGVEASQSAFDSIQGATAEVVQIGLTITASSTEIAEAAGSTATYISEIAQLADRTADLTRSARQQAEAMGNQAQQLLQGIQFFQLPEGTVAVTPTKNIPTATSVNDLNNVSDAFIQESPEDNNLSLGLAVPVLGTLAAAVAATVAISQAENDSTTDTEYSEFNLESDGSNIDHLVMASDGMSLEDNGENPIQESYVEEIPNPFTEDPATILPSDSEFLLAIDPVADSEMFRSESRTSDSFETFIDHIGDQRELLPSELTVFPELDDISIIEESLLADLKQEVYNESISESSFDIENQDYPDLVEEQTLKNPMEGVNEMAISEASGDPVIVSATSSFLEDTAFGTPLPLSEEDLHANLPVSVDFSIPDLDDDDFEIPKMDIESALDNSNSFFDSSNLVQESDANELNADFDPFAMDEQSLIDLDDYAIADNEQGMFDLDPLTPNISEQAFEEGFDDFTANPLEDYNNYTADEAINSSLDTSISNEAFNDTFSMSFDESPFDHALDNALNISPNQSFDADNNNHSEETSEITEDQFIEQEPNPVFENPVFEFDASDLVVQNPEQESDEILDFGQLVDSSSDLLENTSELVNQNDLIPDIYLSESLGDDASEEFTFELDEIPSVNANDLVEVDNLSGIFSDDFIDDISSQETIDLPSESSDSSLATYDDQLEISEPFDFPTANEDFSNLTRPDGFQDQDSVIPTLEIQLESEIQESSGFPLSENEPNELETAFPSFFNDEDTDSDQLMWQPNEIDSTMNALDNLSDLQAELPQEQTFEVAQDLVFEMSTLESDDALLDGIFDFDMSNDSDEMDEFGGLPTSLEGESSDTINEILTDSDLEISSIFNTPNDFSETFSEVANDEPIDDSVISDVDNSAFALEVSSGDLESNNELLEFSAIFGDSSSTNIEDTLDIDEESVIFEAIANAEDMDYSPNNLNFIPPEIDEFSSVSQVGEAIPDLSLDFSDDWLEDITDDQDGDVFADLADLSIGYTSLEDLSSGTLEDANNGFADNLLNNLMDESDDEFGNLSMDLSEQSPILPVGSSFLPNFDTGFVSSEGNSEDLDKEPDFDFSIFDSPIDGEIDMARSEIDEFLSGSLDISEVVAVKKTPKKPDDTKPDVSVKPDTSAK